MNEKGLDEARGIVCLLGVVFIVLGLIIVLVLPAVIPFFSQNGMNLNGLWLVAFGVIGIIITCSRGSGGTRIPSEGNTSEGNTS